MEVPSFPYEVAAQGSIFLLLFQAKQLRFHGVFAETCLIEDDYFFPIAPFTHGVFPAAGGYFTDCRVPAPADALPRGRYALTQVPRRAWMDVDIGVLKSWADLLFDIEFGLPADGFRRW